MTGPLPDAVYLWSAIIDRDTDIACEATEDGELVTTVIAYDPPWWMRYNYVLERVDVCGVR